MRKKSNTAEFKLMMKHRKLIADAMQRGYSVNAAKKLARAAEDSKR